MKKQFPPKKLRDFFKYFDAENPNHIAAVDQLQSDGPARLWDEDSRWVKIFRTPVEEPEACGLNPSADCGCAPLPVIAITPELMERLTGYSSKTFPIEFCTDFQLMLEATNFDQDLSSCQMLMANLMHESANFKYMKEIDPGYYLEGRSDLQNVYPGDGPKFRGCGPLQVTGRGHAKSFRKWLKANRGIDEPRIEDDNSSKEIGTDFTADHYPFQIAISWIQEADLLNVCKNQGFEACCVRINGGYNGYDDRCAKYEICKREML